MDHEHSHADHFTPEDIARLQQGIDVVMTRLTAWEAETPGACACDTVEVMMRAFTAVLLRGGAMLDDREFARGVSEVFREAREICRRARKDESLLLKLRGLIEEIDAEGEP